jgi:hypothetical protein
MPEWTKVRTGVSNTHTTIMKHSTNSRRSLWLATLCLLASALYATDTIAQGITVTPSPCFTITIGTATHSCNSDRCGGGTDIPTNTPCYGYDCFLYNPPFCPTCHFQPCSTHCAKVTICNDKCPGMHPTSFTITCNYDNSGNCRSYCGDNECHNAGNALDPYDIGDNCSWQGPRVMVVDDPNGMATDSCISFIICEAYTTGERALGDPTPVTYTIHCTPNNCPPPSGPPCADATLTW